MLFCCNEWKKSNISKSEKIRDESNFSVRPNNQPMASPPNHLNTDSGSSSPPPQYNTSPVDSDHHGLSRGNSALPSQERLLYVYSEEELDEEYNIECGEETPLLYDLADFPPDYADAHFQEMESEILPSYTDVQRENRSELEIDRSNDYLSTVFILLVLGLLLMLLLENVSDFGDD